MRYLGKPLPRKEDLRLITGKGQYLADIEPEDTRHMAVLRSPHAHATIVNVDLSKAKILPGVIKAAAFNDLGAVGKSLPMIVPHPELVSRTPYPLAKEKVHYVGEPVAVVVADNRYIAEDALEEINIKYEVLPAVVNPEEALKGDSPLIHEEIGSNIASRIVEETGDIDFAFAKADIIVQSKLRIGRASVQPMEGRGVLAIPDRQNKLTIWDSTQSVHTIRNLLSEILGMENTELRVIAPDVGGGFGSKNRLYPEEVLVTWLARELKQPVKWISDRLEDLMASYQERDQWHEAEMALSKDGVILGVRDHFTADNGAFTPFGNVVPFTTAITIPGPYRVPNYYAQMTCVYTNKTPVAPYRGAGRPQGVFVMERLLDLAAQKLGIDKAEIRMRNLITPKEMPYDVGLHSRDGRKVVYHNGDYPGALKQALEMIDYENFRIKQKEYRKKGRYLGIGIANYVEMAALGPFEGARVKVNPENGNVTVSTGAGSQGQGHETTLAQVCAERLGIPFDNVFVIGGDTAAIPKGIGTYASRVAVAGGNAVSGAALKVRKKALHIAGKHLKVDPAHLTIEEGIIYVSDSPEERISIQKIAMIAEENESGLENTYYYYPSALTYGNGSHVAIVDVDLKTGLVKIEKYVVVDDCGKVLNEMIVAGQVRGGVAQGIGSALYESIVHDESGQLITATYMDYLLPTSMEIPTIELGYMESPDPNNPEGLKGVGEGGTVPVQAVINSAIDDALEPFGITTTKTPVSLSELWKQLQEKNERRE